MVSCAYSASVHKMLSYNKLFIIYFNVACNYGYWCLVVDDNRVFSMQEIDLFF